jgi:hypothetical protein
MSRILRAAAIIISVCAAAAGALREAWAASAMGSASLRYRPEAHYIAWSRPEMVRKTRTAFDAEFRAPVIHLKSRANGSPAP